MRSRRARRVYFTTSLEYETEIENGGCALSLFVARESGVLIKGTVIQSGFTRTQVGVSPRGCHENEHSNDFILHSAVEPHSCVCGGKC